MRIGDLRHRVTLQNTTEVSDGLGGSTEVDVTIWSRIPASVEPATARSLERVAANTVTSTASHLVTVRYVPGVTTKTLVVFHDGATDREMAVEGVHDPEERHISLVLECAEAVA